MDTEASDIVDRLTKQRINQYYQRVRQITDDLLYCFHDFPLTYEKVEGILRKAKELADVEFTAWNSIEL